MKQEEKFKLVADAATLRVAGYGEEADQLLAKLGAIAIPPLGHSCPSCSRDGVLYCQQIAVDRLRGLRKQDE